MNLASRAFVFVFATLALDQFTKWLVASNLMPNQSLYPVPELAGVLAITYVTNTGIAFGLFKEANAVFILASIVAITVIVRYSRDLATHPRLAPIALGLLLGGAAGNLIDRLRLGHVVDFIAVGDFPRFNVADSAIFAGMSLLVISFLRESRRAPAAPGADSVSGDTPPTSSR